MEATGQDFRLTRGERLRGKRSIEELFGSGRGGFVHPLRYVWQTVETGPESRESPISILAAAPKRNHKRANRRNTLKRRIREAYRLNKHSLTEVAAARGVTIRLALVYSSKETEEYKTIENAVKKIISRITAEL